MAASTSGRRRRSQVPLPRVILSAPTPTPSPKPYPNHISPAPPTLFHFRPAPPPSPLFSFLSPRSPSTVSLPPFNPPPTRAIYSPNSPQRLPTPAQPPCVLPSSPALTRAHPQKNWALPFLFNPSAAPPPQSHPSVIWKLHLMLLVGSFLGGGVWGGVGGIRAGNVYSNPPETSGDFPPH